MGALAAAGYSADDIERLVADLDTRRLLWLARPHPSKSAVLDLRGFMDFLGNLLPTDFSSLTMPFACVSTDLVTGELVIHREGDLLEAIRASISVPVAFEPAVARKRLLVDGGLVEPVPVDTARHLGARSVVAVTLNSLSGRAFIRDENRRARKKGLSRDALFGPVRRWQIAAASVDIMERRIAAIELERADVVIAPNLELYSQLAFLDAKPIIALGEAAAEKALPRILDLLK